MTIDELIAKWLGIRGGAERANYAQFVNDLCQALDLPVPGVAIGGVLADYQFEGPVQGGGAGGHTGAIDLYKRGCFILEAKQSRLGAEARQAPELFDAAPAAPAAPSGARYDQLMRDALAQARRYAVNLPADHPWPPFLIICDVGRAFELYFDWSGNGRGYGFFPDKQSYRIELPALRDPAMADRLRAIWLNPASIDPRLRAAEVTRGVARRLADVSKWLEETQRLKTAGLGSYERSLAVEESALFLMRLLFCMFAEDIGLLPKAKFREFLRRSIDNPKLFEHGLADLWLKMGQPHLANRFAQAVEDEVLYFNGGLFRSHGTYVLDRSAIGELYEAARTDWRRVEPAIFGTLLEQALTPEERAKLGAHYTPRPYVERLVQATIMDVLEAEWDGVRGRNLPSPEGEGLKKAIAFHDRLATLRILDPACGTGNFLYVAMELIQRLESEVIELIEQLGGVAAPRVGPHQFHGLELNPRAARIAELVLWIGWLRNRLHDDPAAVPQPVLAESATINFGRPGGYDAVLRRDATGEPNLAAPMLAEWPEADFIIGNPPFIGGKDIRRRLGGDYAEAMWRANPRVPKSADFVMQWWDRAAHVLTADGSSLVRFGFVTTNSITQTFSRRVIEGYLKSSPERGGGPRSGGGGSSPTLRPAEAVPALRGSPDPRHHAAHGPPPRDGEDQGLSLLLAVADHPWTKATRDAAAVRIAMTVAGRGPREGRLIAVTREARLDSDHPEIETAATAGRVNADLTVGSDVGAVAPLKANEGIASRGVALHGAGFIVTPEEARALGLGRREGLERHIRPYRHGRDLLGRPRGVMVIDLFGLSEKEARQRFPEVYEHLLRTVKPERDKNRRAVRRENWWLFGELAPAFRSYSDGLVRYIATVETSRHRIFQFLDADILPDNKLLAIGSDDAFNLGVLSSRFHTEWALKLGGWLGVGNDSVYVKSKVFDPFPFPEATSAQRAVIAELAEELDATRRAALAEVPGLTMTEIYNLRAALKSSPSLLGEGDRLQGGGGAGGATAAARRPLHHSASPNGPPPRGGEDLLSRARAARAGIVDRLHAQIDAAVAAAYGWPADLTAAEIVARLVALNAARAAEERAGQVRWLRPEYQAERFGRA